MGLKIIIEKNVPYLDDAWHDDAEVLRLASKEITAETMRDTDALITRTRTKCNRDLLEGSRCKFIGTATIGTDHIDLPYCETAGIEVVNAPGCNAPAVAQYVMSAILDRFPNPEGKTIGIIGVGHVGSIVERWARSLGMNVILCDPPRAEKEGPEKFANIDDTVRKADVVTFHTPLTHYPTPYPTYHLLNKALVEKMERKPLVINAARGSVTDTQALIDGLDSGKIGSIAIDCWEGEPVIDLRLLKRARIATPHIAGYSRQGKERASLTVAEALSRHFGLDAPLLPFTPPLPAPDTVTKKQIISSYDPLADTEALRKDPMRFEELRDTYILRDEPHITR